MWLMAELIGRKGHLRKQIKKENTTIQKQANNIKSYSFLYETYLRKFTSIFWIMVLIKISSTEAMDVRYWNVCIIETPF